MYYKQLTPKNLCIKSEDNSITLKILLGDAKDTIQTIQSNTVDVVFYDSFSPKTQPEMWSIFLFQEVHRVLKQKGILATYSCARLVRDNIKAAGLTYADGPKVGRRGPGTIVWKEN